MNFRMAELRKLADVVVLDSACVLPIADALIVGTLCDAGVLVVAANHTGGKAVVNAMQLKAMLGEVSFPSMPPKRESVSPQMLLKAC